MDDELIDDVVAVRLRAAAIDDVDAWRRAKKRESNRRYKQTGAGRAAKQRSRKTAAAKAGRHKSENRRIKRLINERPFLGIDGEGYGCDEKERQYYGLLRAGEHELYTGKPLSTRECLDFILSLPGKDDATIVGFSFGYDISMILRDLPGVRDPKYPMVKCVREKVLADKDAGGYGYTWWQGFGIDYLPRNYLRLCYGTWDKAKRRMIPMAGTVRTVYEVFGFFQCSFLQACKDFGIGGEYAGFIERMKNTRNDFSQITQEIRDYCGVECDLLAQLMQRFRGICLQSVPPLRPKTWAGAGKLASALHEMHETMPRKRLEELTPPDVLTMASAAYYGGRFEVTRIGAVLRPVWEYDIRSAYPAAMERLACLEHGTWAVGTPAALRTAEKDPASLYVASLAFDHPPPVDGSRRAFCGFPFRTKTGRLQWPVAGEGVYWSVEIRAARRLGATVRYKGGWLYQKRCDCKPFAWVRTVYDYRRGLPEREGKAYKLAINALYGKLAQRIGSPRWANLIWAGLVTAATRATLIDAVLSDPAGVIMFATDGILALRPLPVATGEGLGQWEQREHDGVFVVQPGLYWPLQLSPLPPQFPTKRAKSRGVSVSVFAAHTGRFEGAWWDYSERAQAVLSGPVRPPVVGVHVRLFTGLRVAQARGKPDTAGVWCGDRPVRLAADGRVLPADAPRKFRFDWSGKRGRGSWESRTHIVTYPPLGGAGLVSKPHGIDKTQIEEMDFSRADLQEQADYLNLNPPWHDD